MGQLRDIDNIIIVRRNSKKCCQVLSGIELSPPFGHKNSAPSERLEMFPTFTFMTGSIAKTPCLVQGAFISVIQSSLQQAPRIVFSIPQTYF